MDTGPRFPWQIEDTEMYPRLQSTSTIINLTTKSNSNDDDDDHAHTPAEALPAAWPRETKAAASLASRSSTFPRKPRRSRNFKLGRSVGRLSPEGALDKAEWLDVLGLELRHTGLNEGSTQPRSTVQSGCSSASDGLGLPNSPDCQRSNTQTTSCSITSGYTSGRRQEQPRNKHLFSGQQILWYKLWHLVGSTWLQHQKSERLSIRFLGLPSCTDDSDCASETALRRAVCRAGSDRSILCNLFASTGSDVFQQSSPKNS